MRLHLVTCTTVAETATRTPRRYLLHVAYGAPYTFRDVRTARLARLFARRLVSLPGTSKSQSGGLPVCFAQYLRGALRKAL